MKSPAESECRASGARNVRLLYYDSMRKFFATACCFVLVGIFTACGHDTDKFYRTRADAEKGGEFDRGWLPDFLPNSSHNIHLADDNSPSEEWCGFEFDPREADQLLNNIQALKGHAPPMREIPSPGLRWWPKFLRGELDGRIAQQAEQSGFALYSFIRPASQVDNEIIIFAIDRSNGRAYFYGH